MELHIFRLVKNKNTHTFNMQCIYACVIKRPIPIYMPTSFVLVNDNDKNNNNSIKL